MLRFLNTPTSNVLTATSIEQMYTRSGQTKQLRNRNPKEDLLRSSVAVRLHGAFSGSIAAANSLVCNFAKQHRARERKFCSAPENAHAKLVGFP